MKKITTIITASLLIFSCTKEKLQIQPDKEILSVVTPVKNIYPPVGTVTQINSTTTKTTYAGSAIVIYETVLANGTSNIQAILWNKTDNVTASTQHFTGYDKITFTSTTGTFSMLRNPSGQIADVRVTGNPFQLTLMTFGQCMVMLANECADSWSCKIICGIGSYGCVLGWAVACGASPNVN